jgi:hypothetical protein
MLLEGFSAASLAGELCGAVKIGSTQMKVGPAEAQGWTDELESLGHKGREAGEGHWPFWEGTSQAPGLDWQLMEVGGVGEGMGCSWNFRARGSRAQWAGEEDEVYTWLLTRRASG